jgi:hypothetical protein
MGLSVAGNRAEHARLADPSLARDKQQLARAGGRFAEAAPGVHERLVPSD